MKIMSASRPMNRFWQLMITVRDFSYHLSVKQVGDAVTPYDYKTKILAFISGYVAMVVLIVFQLLFYFGFDSMPAAKNDPWYIRAIGGFFIYFLPLFVTGRYIWKKIEHIPIHTEYSSQQYRKDQWKCWGGFLLGWFLAAAIGMALTAYLRERYGMYYTQ